MLCEQEMDAVSIYIYHKEKKWLLIKMIAAWWCCCMCETLSRVERTLKFICKRQKAGVRHSGSRLPCSPALSRL